MTDAHVVDGSADEVVDEPQGDDVKRPEPRHDLVPAARAPGLAVTPQVKAAELVDRLAVIRDAADKAMQRDIDFGVIPGTDKPTLYKPGAEKLGVLFQLDIQLDNDKTWGPGDHLTVVSRATVYHAPSGARLGFGEGVCTTRERKYAYRKQERICPACGKPAVIKGKAEFGGGWLCWKKRDGCGAKFADNAPEIVDQEVGELDNPDLPDLWNTVVKMAEKRARIDAVLAVTGASALFTQDMDEAVEPAAAPAAEVPREQPPAEQPVEEPIRPQQYKALLEAFAAAGSPHLDLIEHLDELDVPRQPQIGMRIRQMSAWAADDLLAWLRQRKVQQPESGGG